MVSSNVFFEALFNRDISSPGTKDFLAQLAREHPYFTHPGFFLLKQTPKDTEEFNRQLSRSAVLFNNNYWLNYLLISTDESAIADETGDVTHDEETFVDGQEEIDEMITVDETIVGDEPVIVQPVASLDQEVVAGANEIEVLEDDNIGLDTIADEEELVIEENDTANVVNDEIQDVPDNGVAGEIEEEAYEETGEPAYEESFTAADTAPLLTNLNTGAPETKEDTLIFEPLHVTDYFASVGIKLNEEIKPADKLGHQLKSFTEWLKIMKKVHTVPQLETSKEAEQQVQQLAEQSNINGDVITESMADVLAQQGRIEKAVELLEKLSLLNPSKSAYFAAKIEKIKEQ